LKSYQYSGLLRLDAAHFKRTRFLVNSEAVSAFASDAFFYLLPSDEARLIAKRAIVET